MRTPIEKRSIKQHRKRIVARGNLSVAIKADQTVVATGNNSHGECNVQNWNNVVSVSAGLFHTVYAA